MSKFKDTIELCQGLGMSHEFMLELRKKMGQQRVAMVLVATRAKANKTQEEVAARSGFSVETVAGLEEALNDHIHSRDVIRYLQALGLLEGPEV